MTQWEKKSFDVEELTASSTLIDDVLNDMQQQEQVRSKPVVSKNDRTLVGEVIKTANSDFSGRGLVRWVEEQNEPTERWLAVVRGLELHSGDKVLLNKPNNWPEWLITDVLASTNSVQGLSEEFQTEKEDEKLDVEVDGKRVKIDGKDEIVLRCGQASITLRRNGRVVIRGTYVETRSKGTNRIKGGSVLIN